MDKFKVEQELSEKVQREYQMGYDHVRNERKRKSDDVARVNSPLIPQGQVRIELVARNKQLEKAMFLTDEINVKFLSDKGVLGEQIMENMNLVAKYDDIDMNMREIRERIIDDNGDHGLAITVIDGYDEVEEQPIVSCLNPLSIIIDPQNYSGSEMRFFGVERRVSKDTLLSSGLYEIEESDFMESKDLTELKRKEAQQNNLQYIEVDEGYCDIYDHYTIYKGKKWLSTWNADRTKLLRLVEIAPLTKAEKLKPLKCKWPIQLHRRKPKKGSVFGVSIIDEVLRFQDNISHLSNLQLMQASAIANIPDMLVDTRLGLDISVLANTVPGSRVINIKNEENLDIKNSIQFVQQPAPAPFIQEMINNLEGIAEGNTGVNRQASGTSQPGTQTKAEIQTLQQNQNQILILLANNYLQGQKDFWSDIHKSYALNFGEKSKKGLSFYQKGTAISKTLSRSDFIADGKVNVFITSKSQDAIENDKEYNKLIALAEFYLANMKEGHAKNEYLRELGRKSNIRDFDEAKFIPYSVDEENAIKNLVLINKNIEVPGPQPGEDYLTYLQIYRQALETEVKQKVVPLYEEAYRNIQKIQQEQTPQQPVGKMAGAMAMNNLNQQTNTSPSTALVTNS